MMIITEDIGNYMLTCCIAPFLKLNLSVVAADVSFSAVCKLSATCVLSISPNRMYMPVAADLCLVVVCIWSATVVHSPSLVAPSLAPKVTCFIAAFNIPLNACNNNTIQNVSH